MTVTQTVANAPGAGIADGTDTVRNVEKLRFSDQTLSLLPLAKLAPAALTFASAPGSHSPAQTVTLSNQGVDPLTITAIGFTGADAGDFDQMGSTCPASGALAGGASCAIDVRFAPGTVGSKSAALQVTDNSDNAPGSTQTVVLSGIADVTTPSPGGGSGPPTSGGATGGNQPAAPGGGGQPAAPGGDGQPAERVGGAQPAANRAGRHARPSLTRLATSPRITRRTAARRGIRLSMRLGASTNVVRLSIYHVTARGQRRISSTVRVTASRRYGVALRDGALRRALKVGRYVVRATPGRIAEDLGPTSRVAFRVVPSPRSNVHRGPVPGGAQRAGAS